MNLKYSEKSLKIFEERNKLFRIIYDTIINCSGVYGSQVFQLLTHNLLEISNADQVLLTIIEGTEVTKLSQYQISKANAIINITNNIPFEMNLLTDYESIPSCLLVDCKDLSPKQKTNLKKIKILITCKENESCYFYFLTNQQSIMAYGVLKYEESSKLKAKDLVETYLGLLGEIAKREKSLTDLEMSNRRFEKLIENSPTGFLLIDDKQKIIQINKATEDLFGLPRNEIINKKCYTFFCKGMATCPLTKGNPEQKIKEIDIINRKNETLHLIKHAIVIDMHGKKYMLETLVDITNLKKAEKALAQNEQRLHDIIMSTADWFWEIDKSGNYSYVSDAVDRQTGYSVNELQNKHCSLVIDHSFKNKFIKDLEKFYKEENPIVDYENQILTKDGEIKIFQKNGVPTFDETGTLQGFIGVDKDITEKKNAEKLKEEMNKKLLHSTKLAAVGELAAGVAHEVNNPLSIIMGNLEIMKSKIQSDEGMTDSLSKHLATITTAIDRIKSVIQGMKGLSRSESSAVEIWDANEIIRDNFNLINIIYEKEGIHLIMNYSNEKAYIKCSKDQIQQVLLNLISNSRDALRNKKYHKNITINCKIIGRKVILAISDNGSGIPEHCRNKIFQSFFTTKPAGSGTGLGLSICQTIINDHGGSIDFESTINVGSTFFISLPLVEYIEKEKSTLNEKDPTFSLANKKILVVDDEDDIREILKDYLELEQATVMTASNGLDAFEKYQKNNFDLILTDLKMPLMSGDELVQKIINHKAEYPKILIITGELNDTKIINLLKIKDINLLKKPFTRDNLMEEIQILFKH